jgi:hypothetical protein
LVGGGWNGRAGSGFGGLPGTGLSGRGSPGTFGSLGGVPGMGWGRGGSCGDFGSVSWNGRSTGVGVMAGTPGTQGMCPRAFPSCGVAGLDQKIRAST